MPSIYLVEARILENAIHQPFAQPSSLVLRQYKNILKVGKGSIIRDDPSQSDLLILFEKSKTKGVFDCPIEFFEGQTGSPITLFREIPIHT